MYVLCILCRSKYSSTEAEVQDVGRVESGYASDYTRDGSANSKRTEGSVSTRESSASSQRGGSASSQRGGSAGERKGSAGASERNGSAGKPGKQVVL